MRELTRTQQYANAVREQVKKENPDARPAEVVRLIGAKWKDLTAEEKKVCHCHLFFLLCIPLPAFSFAWELC
jgi:hypothetical protein